MDGQNAETTVYHAWEIGDQTDFTDFINLCFERYRRGRNGCSKIRIL